MKSLNLYLVCKGPNHFYGRPQSSDALPFSLFGVAISFKDMHDTVCFMSLWVFFGVGICASGVSRWPMVGETPPDCLVLIHIGLFWTYVYI